MNVSRMNLTLRPGTAEDAAQCGPICFEAFNAISRAHGFPPDFPSPEVAAGVIGWCLASENVFSVVAELDGRVVGSNFLWENAVIAGVGPITVDPSAQDAGAGRQLMEQVLARAREKRFAGVRLVQAAFHNRSLSLYTKLGFDVREPLACIQGTPPRVSLPGRTVRPATSEDLDACSTLCRRVHGFERRGELEGAVHRGMASVVEYDGRITGYTTGIGFFGHSVGESNDDVKALIAAAPAIDGPGVLLPTRNAGLFRWCLDVGLKVTQPMTLMSLGLYQVARGAWLPSILY